MELLASSGDVSALFWTTVATVVLLLLPGVLYAYYVLAVWIGDDKSYTTVMSSVGRRQAQADN
jgi:hypothetical protein